ncbi:MAG: cysteine desulfurase [Tenericutes bacterium]|nr:cysteine desulfurase [Mycoplasmatota bacterium]
MIYLDYSATTPLNKEVLDAFNEANLKIYGNPNSTHKLGILAKELIDETTDIIKAILNASAYEVIYTSGATEANNLAIKGFAEANNHRGKHIISSPYEHSSVTSCLNYLAKLGYEIDILGTDANGVVDLVELEELIREDTILVSIAMINSELGILQDLKAIKEVIKKYSHVSFHSDMTQAIGKINVDVTVCDLVTFTGHKIYGIKGVGALLRKESINLVPVIHGGKSTSVFRGGTPAAPLIYSLGKAITTVYLDFDKKSKHIEELYHYLINELLPDIAISHLNSKSGIYHIVNISFIGLKANVLQKALSDRGIYISTQTACNSDSSFSMTVKRLTGSDELAESSVRVSLSYLTKKSELDELVNAIKEIIHENS